MANRFEQVDEPQEDAIAVILEQRAEGMGKSPLPAHGRTRAAAERL